MSVRRSPWLNTLEAAAYPPVTGTVQAEAVVIGAGITGLTAALFLQRRGVSVAVIEARHIAAGTTGHTTGKVTSQHGVIYERLLQRHGERAAQNYADANQWALEFIAELSSQFGPEVELRRAPAFVYTSDPERRQLLESEHTAASRLGLPSALSVASDDVPFGFELAVRFSDQAHFHAGRYTAGLAALLHAEGGQIFENTRAHAVGEADGRMIVRTEHGDVSTKEVVVTTLLPFVDRGGFFAKTRPKRAYGIAALLNQAPPAGMYLSAEQPDRSFRPWGEAGLVVVGESHETGSSDASPRRWGDLEQWTRDRFDVASFEYRWSAQDYSTLDGLPYVGRSPRSRHVRVATGFHKWGLTNGTAAGLMLADSITGQPNPWLSTYSASRLPDARGAGEALIDNAKVGVEFVAGHAARFRAAGVEELPAGRGAMVDVGDATVGAYRDPAGVLHGVSLTCSHLGCTVRWNDAEETWDCPCHGSRFAVDGAVLEGPATRPLERREAQPSGAGSGDRDPTQQFGDGNDG